MHFEMLALSGDSQAASGLRVTETFVDLTVIIKSFHVEMDGRPSSGLWRGRDKKLFLRELALFGGAGSFTKKQRKASPLAT